jgi:muramidase (phage lysozyme)
MKLNKYQWAAIAAALLTPTLLFAATGIGKKKNKTKTAMQNLKAFLQMIQYAEGTIGINAYRTLYGGSLFNDYSRHPNIAITKWGITSTGCGAYGFLYSTWMELQAALELPDFSPASQDKGAIELIRKKGALPDVLAGNIAQAIYKCRKIWASFPGAGYGQSEKPLINLLQFYTKSGGQLITD